jgi:hypothetical protein
LCRRRQLGQTRTSVTNQPTNTNTRPNFSHQKRQRTTGFSFGYNLGFGIIGGLTPLIVSMIKAAMPAASRAFAPAIWLGGLALVSLAGCAALRARVPRLAKPHIGKMA